MEKHLIILAQLGLCMVVTAQLTPFEPPDHGGCYIMLEPINEACGITSNAPTAFGDWVFSAILMSSDNKTEKIGLFNRKTYQSMFLASGETSDGVTVIEINDKEGIVKLQIDHEVISLGIGKKEHDRKQ